MDEEPRVIDARPVVGLLYRLMRDHFPVGELRQIVAGIQPIPTVFSDPHLARIAQEMAEMLEPPPAPPPGAAMAPPPGPNIRPVDMSLVEQYYGVKYKEGPSYGGSFAGNVITASDVHYDPEVGTFRFSNGGMERAIPSGPSINGRLIPSGLHLVIDKSMTANEIAAEFVLRGDVDMTTARLQEAAAMEMFIETGAGMSNDGDGED